MIPTPTSGTVLVAEPATLLADIITGALVAEGYTAVTSSTSADGLVAAVARSDATVVVVGPSFGRAGLAAAVPALLSRGVRTLLVSPNGLDRTEASIMMAGASGQLSVLTNSMADLPAEVDRVVSDSSPLHPELVRAMLGHWRDARDDRRSDGADAVTLTPREVDVVRGLRDGLTTRLLAARLGVSEKTVEAHKSRLFAKLGAKNSSQALSLVTARGLA